LDERSKLLLRWAATAVKESSPIQREAQQPAIPALDLRNSMLVEVGPKQDEPPKKVEDRPLAVEFAAGLWLDEDAVEFVKPALGDHVHVRQDGVACRVADKVDAQASGLE
jgi:hypothetical protein